MESLINRVLIIDNKLEEVQSLQKAFDEKDIETTFCQFDRYIDNRLAKIKKNRDLIFIDLLLDEDIGNLSYNISTIISLLRKVCKESFGPYGLIVWTKQTEAVDQLKAKLSKANAKGDKTTDDEEDEIVENINVEQLPLFVLALDKSKYLKEGNYDSLLNDIKEMLGDNSCSNFFLYWKYAVNKAVKSTLNKVYKLCGDYTSNEERIKFLLNKLAQNQIGVSVNEPDTLSGEAYKAIDELLYSELCMQLNDEIPSLSLEQVQDPFINDKVSKTNLNANINSCFFIDEVNLDPSVIVPGNIYKVKENTNLKLNLDDYIRSAIKNTIDIKSTHIAIELTPPCDAQNKKKLNRLVGGVLCEIPDDKIKDNWESLFDKQKCQGDKCYSIHYLLLNGKICTIIFDFRYLIGLDNETLLNSDQYELLFRAKPKLFADILQKFSSHASRLGISVLDIK